MFWNFWENMFWNLCWNKCQHMPPAGISQHMFSCSWKSMLYASMKEMLAYASIFWHMLAAIFYSERRWLSQQLLFCNLRTISRSDSVSTVVCYQRLQDTRDHLRDTVRTWHSTREYEPLQKWQTQRQRPAIQTFVSNKIQQYANPNNKFKQGLKIHNWPQARWAQQVDCKLHRKKPFSIHKSHEHNFGALKVGFCDSCERQPSSYKATICGKCSLLILMC